MQRRQFLRYLGSVSLYGCSSNAGSAAGDFSQAELDAIGSVTPDSVAEKFDLSCLKAELDPQATLLEFGEQEGRVFGEARGLGLNGRLYTDLSRLTAETLLTPTAQFYIRTRYPNTLDENANGSLEQWRLSLDGLVRQEQTLTLPELLADSTDQGIHLMECSGNFRAGGFGLMSSARFDGIPLTDILQRVEPLPEARLLQVVGYDEHEGADPNGRSTPGASWILTPEQYQQTGAFLATHMNGEPLPLDHGFPLRLLNPGWYGCSCIKWVTALRWLPQQAPASSQMQEFAGRTHQIGIPELAKDYLPPAIELAAMPIRVERWQDNQGTFYNVVGIIWGGARGDSESSLSSLEVSFDGGESFETVTCGAVDSARSWRLWSVQWQPTQLGAHNIVCRAPDPNTPARRLDSQYYRRQVTISEI